MSNTSSVVSGTAILDLDIKPFDVNQAAAKLVNFLDNMDENTQFVSIDSLPQDIHIVGKSNLGYSRMGLSYANLEDKMYPTLNADIYIHRNGSDMSMEETPAWTYELTESEYEPRERRPLSTKERAKRKLKNKAVKAARKKSRK